jgi:hypothetical protein
MTGKHLLVGGWCKRQSSAVSEHRQRRADLAAGLALLQVAHASGLIDGWMVSIRSAASLADVAKGRKGA